MNTRDIQVREKIAPSFSHCSPGTTRVQQLHSPPPSQGSPFKWRKKLLPILFTFKNHLKIKKQRANKELWKMMMVPLQHFGKSWAHSPSWHERICDQTMHKKGRTDTDDWSWDRERFGRPVWKILSCTHTKKCSVCRKTAHQQTDLMGEGEKKKVQTEVKGLFWANLFWNTLTQRINSFYFAEVFQWQWPNTVFPLQTFKYL